MRYVLTGSIGHISKPLAQILLKAGHDVKIITSKAERINAIEELEAKVAVGSVEDDEFVKESFEGADAVYLMIPPNFSVLDWLAYQKKVADNYVSAIKELKINRAVVLSSLGAHMGKGAGPVDGLAYLEEKVNQLPDVNAVYLRSGYFFYNLYSMIPVVKNMGAMGGAQSADFRMVFAYHTDIAAAAAEELQKPELKGKSVRYISSDERSWAEVAYIIGKAIDKPDLKWVELTDDQVRQGMLQTGLNPVIVEGYIQMGQALRSNLMNEDYWKNRPSSFGKVKLEEFAKEFAAAYKE